MILDNSAFCFLENYRYNSVSKKKYNTAVENLSEMQGIDTGESYVILHIDILDIHKDIAGRANGTDDP